MKTRILILTIFLWGMQVFGQSYLDVVRPFYGMRGASGAESGIVPVSAARSNAVLGNPALLSFSDQSFFSMDVSVDQISGASIFQAEQTDLEKDQNVRFNNMSYIYRVPVYRGAWVWGVNLQPVRSFNSIESYSGVDMDSGSEFNYSYLRQSTGSIYALSIASSFLWTRNTSLGFGISLLTGRNEHLEVYRERDALDIFIFENYLDSLSLKPSYRGFSARMGVVSDLSDAIRFGLSLDFPTRLSVTESSIQQQIESYDDGSEAILYEGSFPRIEYSLWGPWRLGIGMAFMVNPLSVSVNYRYHTYSTSMMSSSLLDAQDNDLDDIIDGQVSRYIRDVHEYSASVNWMMTPLNITFATTVQNHPLNSILENIFRVDAGLGYQLTPKVEMTTAFRSMSWQSDLDHELSSGITRNVEVKNNFIQLQVGFKYYLN
jgi:hypothetical protein